MADTLRVDICYRPLRIGWAIKEGDVSAFRQAIRYSHALWGGKFNPVLIVDREDEAQRLIELFRIDFIWPLGDSEEVMNFSKKFTHLIQPFYGDSIFVKQEKWKSYSHLLDISNALSHWQSKPEWKSYKEQDFRVYEWENSDPLADVFLMQFGAYPAKEEIGEDYAQIVEHLLKPKKIKLASHTSIPADVMEHPNYASLARIGMQRDYVVRALWDTPGFYFGNAANLDDLISFWNIQASDISICFVDSINFDRYADLIPTLQQSLLSKMQHGHQVLNHRIGLWARNNHENIPPPFNSMEKLIYYRIDENFWHHKTVSPPTMHLGYASTLGVKGETNGIPRVNFALANKPFNEDVHFHSQQLVASISILEGLYGDEHHTFNVPFAPELNEFYARTMHFHYNKLRAEPERIGLVIAANEHDSFLCAIPVISLIERIFLMAGFESNLSNSGRIVKQLLTQLGGLQGARLFKIPGARQLIKQFGPRKAFTKEIAIDTIAGKKNGDLCGTFAAHTGLYLEQRPKNTKLTPPDVFNYMVSKGLYRMGIDLNCPKCSMTSWIALDALIQKPTCELCGHSYDASKQLVDSKWQFRRSGVLGSELNAQGAVPVVLTLQQLHTALHGTMGNCFYLPSVDLESKETVPKLKCEVDFVWMMNSRYPDRTVVILAECKDQGSKNPADFQNDFSNLNQIANHFPSHLFETYLLYVKLAPFTIDEIKIAKSINGTNRNRVILLTARELEPYNIYEKLHAEIGITSYMQTAKDMAEVTAQIYFNN